MKSEDVWETRLNVTINSASQTPVQLPDFLSLPELEPSRGSRLANPELSYESAVKASRFQLLTDASSFISRMEARLERDRKRLRDYYGSLQREAASSKRRTAVPPTDEEIKARKKAVNLELDRKLVELSERYQIDASLEPIALLCIELNVLAVELLVQRNARRERSRSSGTP